MKKKVTAKKAASKRPRPLNLLAGAVVLRPDSKGRFDELITKEPCRVFLEMMDSKTLWIGIYPPNTDDCVHVTVNARGALSIVAHEA